MHQAYDSIGISGTARTYQCLKWLYYWKRWCKDADIHVKQCMKWRLQNMHPQHHVQLHLEVPIMPTHFIVMHLIGIFKASPQGNQYALTVIGMFATTHGVYHSLQKKLTK